MQNLAPQISRNTTCAFFLAAFLLVGRSFPVFGQTVTNSSNTGWPQNAVFHIGEVDAVQPTNGNLHIEIPLWHVPGRNGLDLWAKYVYDTKGWYFKTQCVKNGGPCTDWVEIEFDSTLQGKIVTPFDYLGSESSATLPVCGGTTGSLTITYNVTIRDPQGTKHHMEPDQGPNSTGCAVDGQGQFTQFYADDGSGLSLNLGTGLTTRDGTHITFSAMGQWQAVTDGNGNQLTNDGTTIVDTLGRRYPASGLTYFDSNGNTQTIQINYTSVPIHTNLCQWSSADFCNENTTPLSLPSQITLPNGKSYSFTYVQNAGGEIQTLTLPTGAQISYTYVNEDQGGRRTATRTVSGTGVPTGTWQYYYGGTILPTGDSVGLGYTTFQLCNYVGCNPIPFVTSKQHISAGVWGIGFPDYFGVSHPVGTVIEREDTDYGSGTFARPYLPKSVTTTWAQANLVSQVQTDWDTYTLPGMSLSFSGGNVMEKREYGWGSGTPGAILRRTTNNYLHLANSAYLGKNIVDRPISTVVYDSSNNLVAQTQTSYDDSGNNPFGLPYMQSDLGNPTAHDSGFGTGYLLRGNATRIQRWLNTSNSWLTTYNGYDDLGNLISTSDVLGHATQYSYNDNWENSSCVPTAGNTQAYVTQVTNALSQKTKNVYYPCTALVQAYQNQNDINTGRNGTTSTYDLMNRPLVTTFPDGGQTSYNYNGDSLPLKTTKTVLVTPNTSVVASTTYDSLGRVSQTSLDSDPQGADVVDKTYDALGRVGTVSNPHRTGSSQTDGITTYQYDALGRVTQVTKQDGSVVTTQYDQTSSVSPNGTCVTTTDEAAKPRKSCSDALGRLIEVDEPQASTGSMSNPYVTLYSYDALGNLLQVNQKGDGSQAARVRTFTYDSLSRLLTAANPESGTISYSYDGNGNVLQKTSPAPNQTGSARKPSVTAMTP